MMNTDIHTSAQAFGKVMSMIQPKHAIVYHFFDEEGTRYDIYDGIRETYEGPLSMATDMMVWNLTRDGVTERMAVSADDTWDLPGDEVLPLIATIPTSATLDQRLFSSSSSVFCSCPRAGDAELRVMTITINQLRDRRFIANLLLNQLSP
jgi:hypothetical protein